MGLSGGQEDLCTSLFREFESSLVQEFKLGGGGGNLGFWGSAIAARGMAANRSSVVRKFVLYIVWFAYSLLQLLLSLVVLVFILLPY